MGHKNPQQYASESDPELDLAEKYSVLNDQYADLAEKYSQVHEVNKDLIDKLVTTQNAVVNLERRAVDAERTERIKDLYQNYPHFVDVEEELGRCLYSRGSELDHEGFEKHVEQVKSYAKRSSPVTQMIPNGALPAEGYAASSDFGKLVIERYTRMADEGNVMKFDKVKELVLAEMSGAKV